MTSAPGYSEILLKGLVVFVGADLEVNEEDDDAEVNTRRRSRDEISFLVNDEQGGRDDRRLRGAKIVYKWSIS